MEIMRNETTPGTAADVSDDPNDHRIVIETDDHEQIDLVAATDAELEAKLDDFLTWAS